MNNSSVVIDAMHIIADLQWRGLIAQSTDIAALATLLNQSTTFYLGTDPTGESLHAGHLVQYLTVRRLQEAGHRPIIVAGGATGQIGDPREIGERSLLNNQTLTEWNGKLQAQIMSLIDFTGGKAILADNAEWTNPMSAIEFLRDIGKHFSVNVMIGRELVKRRLENEGISFTEFSYMLLQANDYLHLYRKYDCRLQIGGSDQWGNIISGVDLIRKVAGDTVHALSTPLVTDSEGRKIGKSTGGGGVWLDPAMTSSYAWYQYFYNISDADVPNYLKWFSFKSREEIETLIVASQAEPHKRLGQTALAEELTDLIHGPEQTKAVQFAAKALFGGAELQDLDLATLSAALRQAPHAEIEAAQIGTIADLLTLSGLVNSKSAARRIISEGGAYCNNTKIVDENWSPASSDWLSGQWLVLRRGKKNFAGVKLVHQY